MMRVDLCSAPDRWSWIDPAVVKTVADLDTRVIYAVFFEEGFIDPLGLGSHTSCNADGKCWKDFPPTIIARDVYATVLQRVRSGDAHMSALGMELSRQFRMASCPDQASVLWVMRQCAHMPFPDDSVAAMGVRDSMSAVHLPGVQSVDITSEMAVLCSPVSPMRMHELETGGDSV